MLELTLTRKAKEETANCPGEIHSMDIYGEHHLLYEKNGILFYEGKMTHYLFAMRLQKTRQQRPAVAWGR